MGYISKFSPQFGRTLKKLKKKDKILFERIHKKVEEIIDNPEHYKPLRYSLRGLLRVHVGSFIILFQINENVIEFIEFEHHDKAYER